MSMAQLIAQGSIQSVLDFRRERALGQYGQYNRRPRRRKRRVRWPLALARLTGARTGGGSHNGHVTTVG